MPSSGSENDIIRKLEMRPRTSSGISIWIAVPVTGLVMDRTQKSAPFSIGRPRARSFMPKAS